VEGASREGGLRSPRGRQLPITRKDIFLLRERGECLRAHAQSTFVDGLGAGDLGNSDMGGSSGSDVRRGRSSTTARDGPRATSALHDLEESERESGDADEYPLDSSGFDECAFSAR